MRVCSCCWHGFLIDRSDFSHVFAVFDRDHDGTIDFTEFLLAVAAGSPGDLDSHLKYVFEMWANDVVFLLKKDY